MPQRKRTLNEPNQKQKESPSLQHVPQGKKIIKDYCHTKREKK